MMKIGYAVLIALLCANAHAAEKTVEAGRVVPQGEALLGMARDATSVIAGQILKAPNGCIYAVRFQDGVLSLTPVKDEHGQPLCVPHK